MQAIAAPEVRVAVLPQRCCLLVAAGLAGPKATCRKQSAERRYQVATNRRRQRDRRPRSKYRPGPRSRRRTVLARGAAAVEQRPGTASVELLRDSQPLAKTETMPLAAARTIRALPRCVDKPSRVVYSVVPSRTSRAGVARESRPLARLRRSAAAGAAGGKPGGAGRASQEGPGRREHRRGSPPGTAGGAELDRYDLIILSNVPADGLARSANDGPAKLRSRRAAG